VCHFPVMSRFPMMYGISPAFFQNRRRLVRGFGHLRESSPRAQAAVTYSYGWAGSATVRPSSHLLPYVNGEGGKNKGIRYRQETEHEGFPAPLYIPFSSYNPICPPSIILRILRILRNPCILRIPTSPSYDFLY